MVLSPPNPQGEEDRRKLMAGEPRELPTEVLLFHGLLSNLKTETGSLCEQEQFISIKAKGGSKLREEASVSGLEKLDYDIPPLSCLLFHSQISTCIPTVSSIDLWFNRAVYGAPRSC